MKKLFWIVFLGVCLNFTPTPKILEWGFAASRAETYVFPEDEFQSLLSGILQNGLTYCIRSLPKESGLVSIVGLVKAGSHFEGPYAGTGISHFVEHMLFKGTKTRPPGEIEKEIKSLGGYINAHTTLDSTSYEITVPSGFVKNALLILNDMLFNATLNEFEFEREKAVILKEIHFRDDDPGQYLNRLTFESTYLNHPYKFPVIGYENLLRNLKRNDLAAYYSKRYISPNIIVAVSGDIDSGDVEGEILEIFGKAPRKISVSEPSFSDPPINGVRTLSKIYETPLAHTVIAFKGVSINNPDMYALDTLSMILGQGESSRLNKIVVHKLNLAYNVSSSNYTPLDTGLFEVSLETEPERFEEAVTSVLKEIEYIKSDGITEEELEKAKKNVLAEYIFSREASDSQAHDLALCKAYTGNEEFSKFYVKRIKALTSDEVKKAAEKYLIKDGFVKVTLLPKSFVREDELKKSIPKAGDIKKIILPNGIVLLLKEEKESGIIALTAIFKGGVRFEEPDKSGLSELTSNMIFSGTSSMDKGKIDEVLEKNGIATAPFSGNNSFGLKMEFLNSDKDTALEIFSDLVKNSNFPEDQLDKELAKQKAQLKLEEVDVFTKGMRTFRRALFNIHPYMNLPGGSLETLDNIKREDCIKFYNDFARPNNMVLAVFGDIDEKKMEDDIRRLFKGFKEAPLPEKQVSQEPPQKVPRTSEVILDKKEVLLIIGAKTTTINDKDKYTLLLLSAIMSGHDGRLFRKIRDLKGMAYNLGSSSQPGVDPGYFIFYVATSKGLINQAEKIVLEELNLIKKGEISDEELKNSKSSLIGSELMGRETISALSFISASDELFGLGFDNYKRFEVEINKVSKDDLRRVAQKYFPENNLVKIKVLNNGPF